MHEKYCLPNLCGCPLVFDDVRKTIAVINFLEIFVRIFLESSAGTSLSVFVFVDRSVMQDSWQMLSTRLSNVPALIFLVLIVEY